MGEEQRRYLWKAYRDQQAAGGPARDRLPYTAHFDAIRDRLSARFGAELSHWDVWKALSDLDKNSDMRKRLGCVD